MTYEAPIQPYAVSAFNSRGRVLPVEVARDRNEFQRDYTRVLHSRAFRRLQGKTQVFPAQLGGVDAAFRTRMSHSFEVEQIARSICRFLGLNQDLSAVLAIGHDIGHAPFGHLGQDILDREFASLGGFEHNHQALRLVDMIESPYPGASGLNLMFETREGLLKHCSTSRAKTLGPVAERHLNGTLPPLEVQVVDAADQIAYLYGDLEDALDHGLITPQLLMDELPGFKECWKDVARMFSARLPTPEELANRQTAEQSRALVSEVWRRMLSAAISDISIHSQANIERAGVQTLEDVRTCGTPLVCLSDEQRQLHRGIRVFSRARIYDHPEIEQGRQHHAAALTAMIEDVRAQPQAWGLTEGRDLGRQICDLVASQTDTAVLSWYASKNVPAPSRAKCPI